MGEDVGIESDEWRIKVRGWWAALVRRLAVLATALAAVMMVSGATIARESSAPGTLPETTIEPAGSDSNPSSSDIETEGPGAPPVTSEKKPTVRHKTQNVVAKKSAAWSGEVEPGDAVLKLKEDSWAYATPATSATHVEKVTGGKFVNVTGTTHYFARVKLKSGAVGYVPLNAIELSRPTDKIFKLTKDTPVLSEPSHFGKKLAEVHNGHDVHVVGTSLNYMKIRMKDGLEGFIAMNALE